MIRLCYRLGQLGGLFRVRSEAVRHRFSAAAHRPPRGEALSQRFKQVLHQRRSAVSALQTKGATRY